MGLPTFWGYLLFFLVPVVLWLIGALAIRRRPLIVRLLSVVADSDNRLSLSRLQAFAWTLVIFGSFAAAMAIHSHIDVGTTIETRLRNEAAKRVLDTAEANLKTTNAELADAKNKLDTSTALWSAADEKALKSKLLLAAAIDTERSAAEKKAADDKNGADALKAQQKEFDQSYIAKLSARERAQEERDKAEIALTAKSTDWVQIPNAILALAGIALGSNPTGGANCFFLSELNRMKNIRF